MPHLVILYTADLEPDTEMTALCRTLCDTMVAVRDDAGAPLFPIGATGSTRIRRHITRWPTASAITPSCT